MKVVIKNIAELVQVEDHIQEKVSGSSMKIRNYKRRLPCTKTALLQTLDLWKTGKELTTGTTLSQ